MVEMESGFNKDMENVKMRCLYFHLIVMFVYTKLQDYEQEKIMKTTCSTGL